MKAPLYNDILDLCQTMANCSASDDEQGREQAHKALQKLCQVNANTPKDHPLQWEALADFTDDGDQAIDIYQLGLSCAEKLALIECKASILLAMAKRYVEFEEVEQAQKTIAQAQPYLAEMNDAELKAEILEFIQQYHN